MITYPSSDAVTYHFYKMMNELIAIAHNGQFYYILKFGNYQIF